MEHPDRFDPYRVLGVPPGAPLDEVKAAYRRLAKRHHPDAAGPGQLARFLTVQAAYETIARARGAAREVRAGPGRAQGSAADGRSRDAGRDWYAAAREAARARSRTRRGRGSGPRARAGRSPDEGSRRSAWRRTATLGSTTYDEAAEDAPAWDGSAWYGAASGTYWTMNPREYADPRKHGPGYLGRRTESMGDRSGTGADASGQQGHDRVPGLVSGVIAAIRAAVFGRGGRDPRVR